MNADTMRTIRSAKSLGGNRLHLIWSDGTEAEITLPKVQNLSAVQFGDWGHSLVWPDGTEIGADSLWLDTLTANGRGDVRQFLEWRLRHGLSLSKAAEALGISRRTVAYYSNGERKVPLAILLACKGWEVESGLPKAA